MTILLTTTSFADTPGRNQAILAPLNCEVIGVPDVSDACQSGRLFGYGVDTLTQEPVKAPHIFQTVDNIMLTPHFGRRTFGSAGRQGVRAAKNAVNFFTGHADYIQHNKF